MPGASSYVGEDERHHLTVSQSWLTTAARCPELARRELEGTVEDVTTDAAAVGTAVHAAAEECLGEGADFDQMIDAFDSTFYELVELPTFVFAKYNERSARDFGLQLLERFVEWYDHAADVPDAGNDELEMKFEVPLYEDEYRVITLEGQMDVCRPRGKPWAVLDFKTTGRWSPAPFDEKRYAASDIQSTAYTYAFSKLYPHKARELDFRFVVFHKAGPAQDFTVTRGPSDWAWLEERVVDLCHLIEHELDAWPKIGPEAEAYPLCSKRWCAAWSDCRGKHYPDKRKKRGPRKRPPVQVL